MNEIQALRYLVKMYGEEVEVVSSDKKFKIIDILNEKIEERDLNTLYREQKRKNLIQSSHIFNRKVGNYFKKLRESNNLKLKDVAKLTVCNGIPIKTFQSFENGDGVSLYKVLVLCNIYGISGGDIILENYCSIDHLNTISFYDQIIKEKDTTYSKEDIMRYVFAYPHIKELIEMLDCIPNEIRDDLVLTNILRKAHLKSEECIKVSLFDVLQCVKHLEISPKEYLDKMTQMTQSLVYDNLNKILEKEYQDI